MFTEQLEASLKFSMRIPINMNVWSFQVILCKRIITNCPSYETALFLNEWFEKIKWCLYILWGLFFPHYLFIRTESLGFFLFLFFFILQNTFSQFCAACSPHSPQPPRLTAHSLWVQTQKYFKYLCINWNNYTIPALSHLLVSSHKIRTSIFFH